MAIYLKELRTEEKTRYIAQMSDLSDLEEDTYTAYIATVVTDSGAEVQAEFRHEPTDEEILAAVTPGRPLG
jgi:hypothetical protein